LPIACLKHMTQLFSVVVFVRYIYKCELTNRFCLLVFRLKTNTIFEKHFIHLFRTNDKHLNI